MWRNTEEKLFISAESLPRKHLKIPNFIVTLAFIQTTLQLPICFYKIVYVYKKVVIKLPLEDTMKKNTDSIIETISKYLTKANAINGNFLVV